MMVVVVGWEGSQEVLLRSCIHNIPVTPKLDLHVEMLPYSAHSKSIIGKHYNFEMKKCTECTLHGSIHLHNESAQSSMNLFCS